jgi:hypothetical protein
MQNVISLNTKFFGFLFQKKMRHMNILRRVEAHPCAQENAGAVCVIDQKTRFRNLLFSIATRLKYYEAGSNPTKYLSAT